MNVNLTGAFFRLSEASKCQEQSGSIINIASLYGVVSPNHKMYPGTEFHS
jgi:NAD(P)-dependent dehydrogenase (short-subunit alcohol dehydrogenase family)